ncbi:MAG: dihydrodipicolinate reductase [Pseudomonadota bacterium]
MIRTLTVAVCLAVLGTAAVASGKWSLVATGTQFERVGDRDTFVRLVAQRDLRRFGIRLEVKPDGSIGGNAFGRNVTGAWQWRDGYFCRELFWGAREVGANCQEVKIAGNMLRFTSDRGAGDFADLRLRQQ